MAYVKGLAVFLLLAVSYVEAGDPSPLADFGVNITSADQLVFRNVTGRARQAATPDGILFGVNVATFPNIKGQGGAFTYAEYSSGSANQPHWHARATEFFFLLEGTMKVAIIDGANRKFENILNAGDFTFFPQGSMHFQRNIGDVTARAAVFFNSENAGTFQAVRSLFSLENEDIQPALSLDNPTLDFLRKSVVTPRSPGRFAPQNASLLAQCIPVAGA